MPTLSLKGTFTFYEGAKVNNTLRNLLTSKTAIEIIIEILTMKFNVTGRTNRLYFLRGRTGSGKSTLMISELYKAFVQKSKQTMYISEPRVVLDESNANDILRYNTDWSYGTEIAINNGNKKISASQRNHMCFCTPKIMSNKLNEIMQMTNRNQMLRELSKIKIIVIDEVHVLDLPMLALLKNILDIINEFHKDKECPMFIFASATIDIKRMIEYYFPGRFKETITNPFVIGEVAGASNYPVKEIFLSPQELSNYNKIERDGKPFESYVIIGKYILNNCIKALETSQSFITVNKQKIQCRDMLVFLPSKIGINKIAYILINSLIKRIPIYLITEGMTLSEVNSWRNRNKGKKRILIIGYARGWSLASEYILSHPIDPDPEALQNETKIILSTPIIETGKTITTLYMAIDMGVQNTPIYNPLAYTFGIDMPIKLVPINKNQTIQRLGRVGRESRGIFIHFYSKDVMDQFDLNDVPETINNYNLSNIILDNMKIHQEYTTFDIINDNTYLYPISMDIMIRSSMDLINAGFLSIYGEYSNLKNNMSSSDLWLMYAEFLYYIEKLSLIYSLMIAAVYRFQLPITEDMRTINTGIIIKNLMMILNNIDRITVSADFVEGIKLARNKLTEIKYTNMSLATYNRSFTYNKNRVDFPLPDRFLSNR